MLPAALLDHLPVRTLRAKFLAINVPLVVVFTLALFVLGEVAAYRNGLGRLHEKLEETLTSQSAVLTEPIWNLNSTQIGLVIAAMRNDPNFAAAVVVGESGKRLASSGSMVGAREDLVATRKITFARGRRSIVIGELTIAFTDAPLRAALTRRALLEGALLGVLLLAVVIAALVANRHTIGIPLKRLLESIETVKRGGGRRRVEWRSSDEIGNVVVAFNEMQGRQHSYEAKLREAHDMLEKRVTDRTRDLAQANRRLSDSIESIAEGFALFDEQDRLVVCNQRYCDLYPTIARLMTPGAAFSELVQRLCNANSVTAIANQTAQLIDVYMARHLRVGEPFEMHMRDGRTIRVSEHRTREGGTVGIHTDITDQKRARDRLQELATRDTLTGLPNRSHLQDRVEHALAQSRRHGHQVALMVVDLDRFKLVNDSLGHAAGDELLKTVANRLQRCLREDDTVSRMGGDEFTVILEHVNEWREVGASAERVLNALSSAVDVGGSEVVVSASIGIAMFPEDAPDMHGLLKYADAACYHAKSVGRNNYQFFTEDMNAKAMERFTLEKHLRHALERDELHVHYQPTVDVASGRIVGMEALLRWQSPELGLVSPERFIPIAEETGLIASIGEWVLREACAQNKAWRDQGLDAGRVFVNVSPCQFRLQDLAELVQRVLAETGLPPEALGLEITETVLMDDVASALETSHALSAMGVKLVVDDFGIGYSSLSRLKSFPVNALKIDRSFVRDITTDSDALAIVSAIIATAHNLHIKVVAEGVETVEQLSLLEARGCDDIQGFYLSKPSEPAAAARLLERGFRACGRAMPQAMSA